MKITMKNNIAKRRMFSDEIIDLIRESRQRVFIAVNDEISLLYWQIGKRIKDEILGNERADYGKAIIKNLSDNLTAELGAGWSQKHLLHCLRAAETFQDEMFFSALRRDLSWTHIKALIYINDDVKRNFYIEMCRIEKWSSRLLQNRIQSMLYERTAISKKPEETIINDLEILMEMNYYFYLQYIFL